MKILKDGKIFEVSNPFVIDQMLKHGGERLTDSPKSKKKPEKKK